MCVSGSPGIIPVLPELLWRTGIRDENNYQAATRQLSGHSEIVLPPQNV